MKTNRSAAKRMKVTRSGKVRRYKAGKGHLLSKKSGKRRRNLRRPGFVHKGQESTSLRLLGRE
ncbi:MAG: 50S ribosomal protein L35 [Planctomycetota bacterium]